MDVCVILTYRCNSKCSMCHVWQYPTKKDEEVTLNTLKKIPSGIDYLNLTGGEPTLRKDLPQIVDLLYPKAMTLEISSNGLHVERLEPIIRKYPCIKVRFSLEGCESTNNKIRGEKDGYKKKVQGLLRLKELGGKDLGFSMVIQDDNSQEAVDLFRFANRHGFEFATSTLHNGFQFHKSDNIPYDRQRVAKDMQCLVSEMLRGSNIKNWFRAYLNLGLVAKVLGHDRLMRCSAGSDFVFIDPWSDVYACNVRPDLNLGNLEIQGWDEIVRGARMKEVWDLVKQCSQNCWMVGSAKTAMRNPRYPRLPKAGPLLWVIRNKLSVMAGGKAEFDHSINHGEIHSDDRVVRRKYYLNETVRKKVQLKSDPHYQNFGRFCNR